MKIIPLNLDSVLLLLHNSNWPISMTLKRHILLLTCPLWGDGGLLSLFILSKIVECINHNYAILDQNGENLHSI